ncbi:MAG: T9SS type A sorting domain-containing protein [Flavobacteriaceae bacterium]|nr:T9SS type A sorting domain-containing protein [Flavobacteriaceae bacterium]
MNKVILLVLVLGFTGFAQDNANKPQRLKYVTTAPDGSVAMTITDDSSKDNLKLESVNNFYRFEILDPITGEAVLASKNQGKECDIDKTKLASGTYNLRLYTSNFVITSKIAINNTKKVLPSLQPTDDVVASR